MRLPPSIHQIGPDQEEGLRFLAEEVLAELGGARPEGRPNEAIRVSAAPPRPTGCPTLSTIGFIRIEGFPVPQPQSARPLAICTRRSNGSIHVCG
jgi:hypothetical protein